MAIDWQRVRADYESGICSPGEIAGKYGCSPQGLRERIRKEGWARPGKKGKRPLKGAPAKRAERAQAADDHRVLWKGVRKRILKGLECKNPRHGFEELKMAKVAGEAITSVIRGEKEAQTLGGGSPASEADETEDITREMASITVPQGTDEALDGE